MSQDREQLVDELEMLYEIFFNKLKKEMKEVFEEKVTSAEFVFLKFLTQRGPQMVTALSDEFDCSPSHITVLSDRLIKKGYLSRQRSEIDRRVVTVSCTPKGKEVIGQVDQLWRTHRMKKFDRFSREELTQFIQLFRKLT